MRISDWSSDVCSSDLPLSQGLLMRAAFLLVPLLLLAACKDEPDFDTRYDKAAKEIEARAKAMDTDIAEAERAVASKGLQGEARPSNRSEESRVGQEGVSKFRSWWWPPH